MDDIEKTDFSKYLVTHYQELFEEYKKFNAEISEHLNRKTDELGTVLKCHLIIEYYLDSYLKVSHPAIVNWEDARLSFNQKLELANNFETSVGIHYPSIKCINSIRNKFAHNTSYKIIESDYRELEKVMTAWYEAGDKPKSVGLNLIVDYTVFICATLNAMINNIQKESKEFGLAGYLKWLKETQKIK